MTQSHHQESTQALVELGFTELEADVYAALMEESPATAYRLAQRVGKAAANVYKAVESLEKKGAVLIDDGDNRLCRPVPPHDLLRSMEAHFNNAKTRAAKALARITKSNEDQRVYQLRSREQVLERAQSLLRRAKQIILGDLFPLAVDLLRNDLEAAANRGCRVVVQVYEPTQFSGPITMFDKTHGDRQLRTWPGQWLNLVGDAQEHLLALLHAQDSGVHQATWTESRYLSVLYHSGLKNEMAWSSMNGLIASGADLDVIRARHKELRLLTQDMNLPGYISLLAQFGAPPPPPPGPHPQRPDHPSTSTRKRTRG